MTTAKFQFKPIKFSWVALHPQPVGVVYFIGGAFFGTFPTLFYRYFLRRLFEQGYTIVALPFRFTFRHWSVATGLVRYQSDLRAAMIEEAAHLGYSTEIYQENPQSSNPNYFWVAHSVGCKYVALLELLSDLEQETISTVLDSCVGADQYQELRNLLDELDIQDISLRNQPSLLMAPVIAGIKSAIPVEAIATFFQKLGLDVQPNVAQTYCLIQRSRLFNLTGLIAFGNDKIATEAGTVRWLQENIGDRLASFSLIPRRKHLSPLGFRQGDATVADTAIESLQKLSDQLVELTQ